MGFLWVMLNNDKRVACESKLALTIKVYHLFILYICFGMSCALPRDGSTDGVCVLWSLP